MDGIEVQIGYEKNHTNNLAINKCQDCILLNQGIISYP